MKFNYLLVIGFVLSASCTSVTNDVYQKTTFLPDHSWAASDKKLFSFKIADTSALYNIYVIIRHTDAYHYNNIWLNVITEGPNDKPVTQQLDVTLGDNAKGWLGTGMDDIYEHRILITRQPISLKSGEYKFAIQQTMREDPLLSVLNAGILIEKVRP